MYDLDSVIGTGSCLENRGYNCYVRNKVIRGYASLMASWMMLASAALHGIPFTAEKAGIVRWGAVT